jgi:hypothetical protein
VAVGAKTKKQMPVKEVSIADLIGLVFAPQPSEDDAPPEITSQKAKPTQITTASPAELAALTELATETCELYDEIQELVGEKTAELSGKKKELLTKMLGFGMKRVEVPGRPPVELVISNNKNSSKAAIISVTSVAEGTTLWNKLPTRSSESLKIHPKTAPTEG